MAPVAHPAPSFSKEDRKGKGKKPSSGKNSKPNNNAERKGFNKDKSKPGKEGARKGEGKGEGKAGKSKQAVVSSPKKAGGKGANPAEKRLDPSDGNGPFTYASFLKYHGQEKGDQLWAQAAK